MYKQSFPIEKRSDSQRSETRFSPPPCNTQGNMGQSLQNESVIGLGKADVKLLYKVQVTENKHRM